MLRTHTVCNLLKKKLGQEPYLEGNKGSMRKIRVGSYSSHDMMVESLGVKRRHVENNRGNVRLCGSTGIATWRARKFWRCLVWARFPPPVVPLTSPHHSTVKILHVCVPILISFYTSCIPVTCLKRQNKLLRRKKTVTWIEGENWQQIN